MNIREGQRLEQNLHLISRKTTEILQRSDFRFFFPLWVQHILAHISMLSKVPLYNYY